MKDIGYGILNPYTITIVFIVFVLAQTLFGYPIPFELSNATQLFIGLVLFTGYLYAAQSLVRLPIATIVARLWIKKSWKTEEEFKTDLRGWLRFKYNIRTSFKLLRRSPLFIGYWFLFVTNFTEMFNKHAKENGIFSSLLLAILDRLALVLIVFLAVLPQFKEYFQMLAIVGLILLVITFILKGNFVGLLNDEIKKEEEKENKTELPEPVSPLSEEQRKEMLRKRNSAIQQQMEQARANTQPSNRSAISDDPDNSTF